MATRLSKSSIAVLCMSIVALISMCLNFFGDSFFEMIGEESYYYDGIEVVLAWIHLVTLALINIFNWVSKKDSALLFSGINLLSLLVLFTIQLIGYNYPEFGIGFFLMAAMSIAILIICYKVKKQSEQDQKNGKAV